MSELSDVLREAHDNLLRLRHPFAEKLAELFRLLEKKEAEFEQAKQQVESKDAAYRSAKKDAEDHWAKVVELRAELQEAKATIEHFHQYSRDYQFSELDRSQLVGLCASLRAQVEQLKTEKQSITEVMKRHLRRNGYPV